MSQSTLSQRTTADPVSPDTYLLMSKHTYRAVVTNQLGLMLNLHTGLPVKRGISLILMSRNMQR